MKRFGCALLLVTIGALSFTFLIADEGLFTPDKIKYLKLDQKGMRISAKEVFNPGGEGLQEAIISG